MIISEKYNVFGGPRPASLKDVELQGVKRIINLEAGVYEALTVYTNSRPQVMFQFPCEYGMREYNMPLSSVTAPDKDYVRKIIQLCADGMPTFIHCAQGRDRTGFVGAAIKMQLESWTYGNALAWWKDIRHPWYFIWDDALKEWSS